MLGSVQPGKLRDDWSVGFMTERYCRKIVEIERGGRLTLAYVTLIGRPVIIDDVALKRSVWSPAADQWHRGGPDDPNVVILRLMTDRIEIWSSGHDVMPEPRGFSAAVLARDGLGWRYSTTSQWSAA